jgi:hypothetical protein
MGAESASGSTSGGYGTGSNPSATGGTTGTNPSGTSATGASSADKGALMLKGKDSDLQKHLNHRVEIRGTLDKSATGGDTSMTNPPSANPPSTAGTAGSTASSQGITGTLTVSSVREISGSCSAGGNR